MDRAGEARLVQEKTKAYCGSIKVPLHLLKHEGAERNPRQFDFKNVQRLITVFKLEGCLRLDPDNHVPVLISRETLNLLLSSLRGTEARLTNWDEQLLFFEPTSPLTILHGRHRLEAARKFLRHNDKWWAVDLLVEELLSPSTANYIRKNDLNSSRFCDGDIFRHLRFATLHSDLAERKKWLARLSITKRRDVLQLEKRANREHETALLLNALDSLLPLPGLWLALKLGTFHRLLSLRCPEVSTLSMNLASKKAH